jgi:hypothetical protein
MDDVLDKSIKGLITVQISASEPGQASEIALTNMRRDINLGEIGKLGAVGDMVTSTTTAVVMETVDKVPTISEGLRSVLSKLNVFVEIVDKVSKVRNDNPFCCPVL